MRERVPCFLLLPVGLTLSKWTCTPLSPVPCHLASSSPDQHASVTTSVDGNWAFFATVYNTQLISIFMLSHLLVQLPPCRPCALSPVGPLLSPCSHRLPHWCSSGLFSWQSVVRQFNFALTLNQKPWGPSDLLLALPQPQITPNVGFSVLYFRHQCHWRKSHTFADPWVLQSWC